MGDWTTRKLGDFLKPYRIEHIVQDDTYYRQVKISKNHGISFRGSMIGKSIGRKRQFIIDLKTYPNTALFTRQGIRDGAIGIAPLEVDKCIVTENMPMMSVDTNLIEMAYLRKLLLSEYLYEKIRLLTVVGSAQKSIHERDFLNIAIELPHIKIQETECKRFNSLDAEHADLKTELTHQQTLLKKLRQQILQEAIEGKLTADWRKQHKLSPCQGGVPRSGEGVKPINNLPHLKTFRKTLRKNLTPAEAKLWTMLKGKQLQGRKFRRQHSVANYILDFYCPAENLAIELDGEVHNNPAAAECDRERDIFLAYTGIKVLRFENKFVFNNPDGLLAYIQQHFNSDSFPDPSAPSNPSAPSGHLPLSGEEDEHASELLKRIRAEKAQLIKDKKIKPQKPLPPIGEEEKPFELPDGWEWCRLGEVMLDIEAGKSPTCYNYPAKHSEWGVLKISAISWGTFNENENKRLKPNIKPFIDKEVKIGDFIMTRANTKELVAKSIIVGNVRQNLLLNDKTLRVLFSKNIDQVFINFFNNGDFARQHYIRVSTGASPSMKNVSRDNIKSLLLPLPPLPEQKAIVTKVEKLLTLCDQLETQITDNQTHAKQLMQAVLKEAFSRNV